MLCTLSTFNLIKKHFKIRGFLSFDVKMIVVNSRG